MRLSLPSCFKPKETLDEQETRASRPRPQRPEQETRSHDTERSENREYHHHHHHHHHHPRQSRQNPPRASRSHREHSRPDYYLQTARYVQYGRQEYVVPLDGPAYSSDYTRLPYEPRRATVSGLPSYSRSSWSTPVSSTSIYTSTRGINTYPTLTERLEQARRDRNALVENGVLLENFARYREQNIRSSHLSPYSFTMMSQDMSARRHTRTEQAVYRPSLLSSENEQFLEAMVASERRRPRRAPGFFPPTLPRSQSPAANQLALRSMVEELENWEDYTPGTAGSFVETEDEYEAEAEDEDEDEEVEVEEVEVEEVEDVEDVEEEVAEGNVESEEDEDPEEPQTFPVAYRNMAKALATTSRPKRVRSWTKPGPSRLSETTIAEYAE